MTEIDGRWDDNGLVGCGCCGRLIEDTPEENQDYETRGHDIGFGMCKKCGGDPKATDFWKRMGWAGETFYKARFSVLEENLSAENAAKFKAMTDEQKVRIVAQLIERGAMI